jgi:hypothetical protein
LPHEKAASPHPSVVFTEIPPRIKRLLEIAEIKHLFTSDATGPR